MLYTFQDFEFNSESLVLQQNGEAVAIRHNEARVLLVLIENADKVLSKEDILSLVWQAKIVSDQAVFQNISHLRNILGSAAIKTFPKRGYQWQLAVNTVDEASIPERSGFAKDNVAVVGSANKAPKSLRVALMFSVILMTVIGLIIGVKSVSDSEKHDIKIVQIGYIPFSLLADDRHTTISLEDSASIDITPLNNLTTSSFAAAEELEYRAISAEFPLVLTGNAYHFKEKYYVDFILRGPVNTWQGQLTEHTLPTLLVKLHAHLAQPFIYDFVSTSRSPELVQASLSIAHQQSPDDLIILGQLINSYISLREYEKAMTLADKLFSNAQAQQNVQQEGVALLYQSKVLTQKELFELSEVKLLSAREKFVQVHDLARQADTYHAHSWINHQLANYAALRENLIKAAELSEKIQDVERELDALTYLSVLAHKHGKTEDKYHFLTQAEQKMTHYQLPIYRFAKIPFHHAIYTASIEGKEPHLKRVLEFTELTPDHWVAQSSRRQLMDFYLNKNRLQDAQRLLEQASSENANNAYLKALYARANNQQGNFIRYAKNTFEQAQLAGERRLSLDAALMLCSDPDTQENFDFYSQFIRENATEWWRKSNLEILASLRIVE